MGERLGSDKFSTDFLNKTNWDREDHCVYVLFHIYRVNTKTAQGLFFNKDLSPGQIHLKT